MYTKRKYNCFSIIFEEYRIKPDKFGKLYMILCSKSLSILFIWKMLEFHNINTLESINISTKYWIYHFIDCIIKIIRKTQCGFSPVSSDSITRRIINVTRVEIRTFNTLLRHERKQAVKNRKDGSVIEQYENSKGSLRNFRFSIPLCASRLYERRKWVKCFFEYRLIKCGLNIGLWYFCANHLSLFHFRSRCYKSVSYFIWIG